MADATFSLPAGLPADPVLLAILLDLLPMGVIYYTPVDDAAGILTDLALAYLNPAAQRMTQLPAQPGTTYRQQFPTTDANGAWEFHRRTWLGQEPQQFQFYYDVDGFDSYFRVTAQRLGEGLLVVFTDTQDEARSAAEDALRESQAREQAALAEAERQRGELARVFELAPVAIAVYQGPEYRIELANPVSCQLLNRPADELLGKPLFEALPELAGHGFEQVLASVYTTGQPVLVQEQPGTHARAGQLDTLYWNLAFVPMRAPDGHITGALSAGLDVTEQVLTRQQVQTLNEELAAINEELRATNEEYQQANLTLAETQQQLRQLNQELEARVQERTWQHSVALAEAERQRQSLVGLVQQAPAALCIVEGPDFVYEAFNPLYAEMFGGRPQVGRPMGEVLPEVVNHPGFLAFRGVYNEGHTIRQREVLVPLARPGDGVLEDRYFSYTQQPRYDQQGQVNGVFVFAVEVTDQVQARQQVQELNEELAAINEELRATNEELHQSNTQLTRTNVDLDTFVYTASHDLKAPITNIESITLALRETLPAAVQQEEMTAHLLDLLEQTTTRFQVTIGQLTDLSKLQLVHAGPAEPVSLTSVIESVRLDLVPVITAADAQLTVEVAPDLVVSFSPANLRSAIYNLLSNAVKYRDLARPAQVQVRAYPVGKRVVLEVQDNGLGLNAHQQSRLFGLFQRLHTHVEGTGVGLYTTKRLVENGGGTIAVASQVDMGTTFTLTFPA